MSFFFRRSEMFLGVISTILLGVCWMNYPEVNIIFVGAFSLLTFFNFLFFKQIVQKSKFRFTLIPQRVFSLYGFSAIAITIASIGVIFRQMFLEGAYFLLLCGMAMLALSLIIHVIIFFAKKKQNAVKVLKRLLIYFVVASFFYFVPNDTFVYLNLRKHPEYAELVRQSLENPDNIELRLKVREARKRLKEK